MPAPASPLCAALTIQLLLEQRVPPKPFDEQQPSVSGFERKGLSGIAPLNSAADRVGGCRD